MISATEMVAEMTSEPDFEVSPGSFKVLYIYSISDGKHEGRLKIGDAIYHTSKSIEEIIEESNSQTPFRNVGYHYTTPEIEAAARRRIDQQTYTADVEYTLEAAYLAVRPDLETSGRFHSFRDYDIHEVLARSGIKKSSTYSDKKSGEWFEATLKQVNKALTSFQQGKGSI